MREEEVVCARELHLDDADGVGNLEGLVIVGELDVSLLQTIGSAWEEEEKRGGKEIYR